MIQPPRRSVTRFFIPLIDVLILLFCIFLLMPFVSSPDAGPGDPADTAGKSVEDLRAKVLELELKLEQARQEAAALKKERANPFDRKSIRVLEIDPADGTLYHFDPTAKPPRVAVADRVDAEKLILRQKREANGKDVFFLIQFPRDPASGFPTQPQVNKFREWFKGENYGFDRPGLEVGP